MLSLEVPISDGSRSIHYFVLTFVALIFPITAAADVSGTVSLSAGSTFNFDTGKVGNSGGDILFATSLFTLQDRARAVDNLGIPGSSDYNGLTQSFLSTLLSSGDFSQLPIRALADKVFGVYTNGKNFAKVLVTAASTSSVTFQFVTFGISGTPSLPIISLIQNNYSYTLPGLPNYGIAPGSLFIIKGTGLNDQPPSALQSSLAPGIPTSLNGTSISITVNGITTKPAIYYTSSTQISAVLPSNTPVGNGMLTVTNNGLASSAVSIQVVASAFGLNTIRGTGVGQAVAQDASFRLFTPTYSASPGQPIILWGSGLGADPENDDRTYPQKQNNLAGISVQVEIAGMSAPIAYRGRSQFPGVDQIVVTVPSETPSGCWVSILIRSGIGGQMSSSNVASIPVAQNGVPCSDPGSPFNQYIALSGQNSVTIGNISIFQSTAPVGSGTITSTGAQASFYRYTQAQFAALFIDDFVGVSAGSCLVTPARPSQLPPQPGSGAVGLNAGSSISVAGPSGSVSLVRSNLPGIYATSLSNSFLPSTGGAYTFSNGSGGPDVKSFSASLNIPPQIVWTDADSISTVNRSQGLKLTWTGGASDEYVIVAGSSGAFVPFQSDLAVVSFGCLARASAQTFTVPASILMSLPAQTLGALGLANSGNGRTFSADGLDAGFVVASASQTIRVSYE